MKHLLVADLTKRFGNLKNGVNDIKRHRFFTGLDWLRLEEKQVQMPYRPTVRSPSDTSNFSHYPDSPREAPPVRPSDDPFVNW